MVLLCQIPGCRDRATCVRGTVWRNDTLSVLLICDIHFMSLDNFARYSCGKATILKNSLVNKSDGTGETSCQIPGCADRATYVRGNICGEKDLCVWLICNRHFMSLDNWTRHECVKAVILKNSLLNKNNITSKMKRYLNV